MSITLSALQKQRRDTAANWTAENPTLLAGEIGLESDTGYWKVGNGSSAWNSLAYVPGLGAELPVSRLADGTARQLLQTAANGTDVEWTSNVDVPGTLDVTGAATFDNNVTVQGDLTVNGTEVIINTQTLEVEDKNVIIGKVATPTDLTADGGGITLKGTTDKTINWIDATDAWTLSEHVDIASSKEYRINGTKVLDATSLGSSVLITSANITDGTIVNADVNASAAIAGTKISPDFGSQNVTTTGTATAAALIPSGSSVPTNGVYLPSANNVAISTNGTRRLQVSSDGTLNLFGANKTAAGGGNTVVYSTDTQAVDVGGSIGFGGYYIGTSSDTEWAQIAGRKENSTSGNYAGYLQFATRVNGGSTSEKMRLTSDGKLGLGTSSPGYLLTVNGRISYSGAIGEGADTTLSSASTEVRVAESSTWQSLSLYTAGSQRLKIDSSGRVGIGTTSPDSSLNVVPGSNAVGLTIHNRSSNDYGYLVFKNNAGTETQAAIGCERSGTNAGRILFETAGSERARIDSSGRLLVGTSSSSDSARLVVQGYSADSTGASILVMKRGSAASSLNSAGYDIGLLDFMSSDSGLGARIKAVSDGVWSSTSDCPTRLEFSTTADGASSPTERMRIGTAGAVDIGTFNPTASSYLFVRRDSGPVAYFDRKTNDGTIIEFRQDDATEGTISVSGTTVSYNGAHLSRWSQLPGGAERTEILRGTVLSNIDEMCGWGEEENEQLNRMKVSDVEGDPNVSGVFQAWDDDDDTYTDDFYCAMTGDFIIRIAEGVTVQRGDLLMSAGDGTAKPQNDDIIRSKTVAKVTSTHVTCTYDDGSYCVPCVLMAC